MYVQGMNFNTNDTLLFIIDRLSFSLVFELIENDVNLLQYCFNNLTFCKELLFICIWIHTRSRKSKERSW